MRRSIVWFKTDLRLHDNETLVSAINHSDEVLPIYCFDDAHFEKSEFGFKKTGNFRAQFLLESLTDLDNQLRALGSGLLILRGNPAVEIIKVANKYGAQKVYAKKEVAYEEKNTESIVEKGLWKIHSVLELFSTSTLYHAEDLTFSIKDIPDVFTNFRKKTERESSIRPIFDTPKAINSPNIKPLELPSLEQLGLEPVLPDDRKCFDFKGGETEGIKRLHYYFSESKKISTYKETRNELLGADYSSKFSAWLAQGCLSPREIYYELKKYELNYGENESTYWLVFELMWRDYFRFMMKKHRNKFFTLAGIKNSDSHLLNHNSEILQKWIDGKTGVDFVDANMLELKHTGFMSNRGRQNVASYLVNDLKLDWRYGAAYFEQQLIDYDVCSNWGNWAYRAGVGNDPRGKRYFNIEKQAEEYDKEKLYRNRWLSV
ncbi:MAG: DASH family cryptochrome [Bacteroidia bacterium]